MFRTTLVVLAVVATIASVSASIRPQPELWSSAERAGLDEWCASGKQILSPECGGFIGGIVWSGVATNCSFVLLDNETDKTRIVDAVNVCADHRHTHTTRPSPRLSVRHPRASASASASEGFTAFDNPTKQILYATGDGSYVYGVNVNGQGSKTLASLPAHYAPLIGLAVANGVGDNGAWYVVTTTSLLQIDASSSSTQSVLDLTPLHLSVTARVTAFNCTLYVIDGLAIHTVDLLALTTTTTSIVDASLATALTITYWPTNNTLVTVTSDRVITQIDLTSGRSWAIMSLPTGGSGAGAIDRSTNFFDMYFVTDSASMYLVNLSARQLETTAAWPGANTKSNIQYYY